jgi:N-formylglutamate deformylase
MAQPDETTGFEIVRPASVGIPVVVHAPHGGTAIPTDVRRELLLDDRELATELLRMTDHRTDELARHLVDDVGATAFVNRLSRLVVDPERFLDPAEEPMEAVGMGAVYTLTHDLEPLREPDGTDRDALVAAYVDPYATALADLVTETVETHGACLIVDLHSYPAERLPYEQGGERRPAVCIGTDADHTPQVVVEAVERAAAEHELDTDRDTPFAGTYVPLAHLGRDRRVRSVMLELRRDTHVDETTGEPHDGYPRIERFLVDAVTAVSGPLGA